MTNPNFGERENTLLLSPLLTFASCFFCFFSSSEAIEKKIHCISFVQFECMSEFMCNKWHLIIFSFNFDELKWNGSPNDEYFMKRKISNLTKIEQNHPVWSISQSLFPFRLVHFAIVFVLFFFLVLISFYFQSVWSKWSQWIFHFWFSTAISILFNCVHLPDEVRERVDVNTEKLYEIETVKWSA